MVQASSTMMLVESANKANASSGFRGQTLRMTQRPTRIEWISINASVLGSAWVERPAMGWFETCEFPDPSTDCATHGPGLGRVRRQR